MAEDPIYNFTNAPDQNNPAGRQFAVGDRTFTTHVLAREAFKDSEFLKALQAPGLWDQTDFRLNGVQRPSGIDGRKTSSAAPRIWEVIAPFGGAEEIVKDLKLRVFPQREIRYLVSGPQGKQVKVA